jgi:hypothetical protein
VSLVDLWWIRGLILVNLLWILGLRLDFQGGGSEQRHGLPPSSEVGLAWKMHVQCWAIPTWGAFCRVFYRVCEMVPDRVRTRLKAHLVNIRVLS